MMRLIDLWFRRHHDAAARAALEAALRDHERVEAVALRAEKLAERNGFSEAIMRAMGVPQ